MPLPPIPLSDDVQKQAYEDLAKGSMRQFGDALAVLVRKALAPQIKSPEERALDWQSGEEASENRRRLAAEALDRVQSERRILPAPQIAGPIFRDSEFELPETPIWEMWSQLLSRACDRERAGEAHPAFPGIIQQLSADEAKLLTALRPLGPRFGLETGTIPKIVSSEIGISLSDHLPFYTGHLGSLGLLMLPNGWDIPGYDVMVDGWRTYLLSPFGQAFMAAVSSDDKGTA